MSRRATSADPHEYFKVIEVSQGWKTGRARCKCGTEFAVTFYDNTKHRVILSPGQGCPNTPRGQEGGTP